MGSIRIFVQEGAEQVYAFGVSELVCGAYQHVFRFLPLAGSGQRLAVCIHLVYISLQRGDGGSIGLLLEQRLSFLVESLGRSTLLACLC